ncbi:PQQ-dependent sugar dehydrogenase [Ruegeria atlantica]|uniref:PQQ-dependent sugar dehydrogenase n=1 Tax=Ruegeria atlantica TaxID=81569 RepID=UPI002494EE15|nr:PQQ-dependent sugar dehydrogenase [Ruegeria atlantica]
MLRIFTILFFSIKAGLVSADTLQTSSGPVQIEPMTQNLDEPWAIGVLPDKGFLVTERNGELLYVLDGQTKRVKGVPRVSAKGQGGLLDVTIARDFLETREIFLTFTKHQFRKSGNAIAVARLSESGDRLTKVRVIFEAVPGGRTGKHFGSRVVEAQDGTLLVTIGDRGDRPAAQDTSNHMGSVVRVNRNGTVPDDNPFVGNEDVRPEIWSIGHRNPQGAGLDAQGRLWISEHGAKGGDEVNLVQPGLNYGWPVISYGVHYSGEKIGEGTAKPGMEQPEHYWDPSMAPSGLMVYSGKLWPDWKGNIFVGSLKFDYIARLTGSPLQEVEQIKGPETIRVRDIVEAPDGSIWFISVGEGAVYRLSPQP